MSTLCQSNIAVTIDVIEVDVAVDAIPDITITTAEQGPPGPPGPLGPQGPQGPQGESGTINGSSDVDISQLNNGSMLVYSLDTAKWVSTTNLEQQVIEGGHF